MKTTQLGSGYLEIDEDFLNMIIEPVEEKIHLIKLKFKEPNQEKILTTFKLFPKTNRFIVSDNIRVYNSIFKATMKKYYVENQYLDNNIISFFKKNNKICFNFTKIINSDIKKFILDELLEDILKNVEVIKVNDIIFKKYHSILKNWYGNVIIV